ncbi:hypothetical protein, partial [Sphingomonas adhaesiva]
MAAPIFFDPTGRRSRRSKRVMAALLAIVVLAAVLFATTLLSMSPRRDIALPLPQPRAAAARGAV